MTSTPSQSARKRKKAVVVDLGNESDGDIVVVGEKRPPSQPYEPTWDPWDPEDNPLTFYSQNEHPKFYVRNLERRINKEREWSKPLPEVSHLFFTTTAPKTVEDLAINPRTVAKLKSLLSIKIDDNSSKLLLITGPAGSGKSTAIDVVARSLNFEVLKWERDSELEVLNGGKSSYLNETTLPEKPRRHKMRTPSRRRLYHIEDLPLLAYKDVEEFRRIIYSHLRGCNDFIVFDLTSRDSSWLMSPRRIFTKSFVRNLGISELEFYPVASTFIRKGLRRAVDYMGFRNRLSAHDYRDVEKLANGDIRSGINIIQYSLLCSRENFSIPNVFEATSNDERENDGIYCLEMELPVREELRRPPPTREINDVLEMSKTSADTVMMFLHEHEPNFSGSIAATRKVFDAMSFCDSISTEWEARLIGQDFVSQICARSTMFYNYRANRIARGLYKYNRPKWFRLSNQIQTLKEEILDVMKSSGSFDRHFGEIDVPYLSVMKSSLTGCEYRLVTYLTRPWKFSWDTDRSLWDHQIASDPSYRMAQFRENARDDSLLPSSQIDDEDDNEVYSIEDSENEIDSDDSFNDPVTFD
ncbi:hypothetical protein ANCCEY_10837 [Ancylostoma ceylanicum]|uniref:Rad17 cell cycle checkpoint protein n=1 Tax=Ancylostoma ceylanicum TaxID=53326 RepID=A0A0D6LQY9_9BILA|nr:hypothetical protein ANCCEY_10837 [Ancylostoma ceylanicum]